MPTVPYASVPTVQPLPMPRLRRVPELPSGMPSEAFGGGVAGQAGGIGNLSGVENTLEQVAAQEQRIRLEERAKANEVAVTDAASQIVDYSTQALHHPEHGYLNQFGKNAFDVPDRADSEFWNVSKVIRDGLSNPDQQAVYDKIVASQYESFNRQIQIHVAQQKQVYDKEATQAALDALREQAVKSYSDPLTVEPAIIARAEVIKANGQRLGLPDEFIQNQIAQETSQTRLDVLKQYVDNGQDLAANAYLEKYREQFQLRELTQAETLTKHATVEGEAQRNGDRITSSATGLGEALKQAALIQEPEVRKATEQRVRQYYNDVAAAERQSRSNARQQLGTILERNHGDINSINRTSAWVLNLNDTDRTALEHRAEQIRNPVVRSNQALVTHWRQMSALPQTQAQFLSEDFTAPKYQQTMSEADRNWMISRQIYLRSHTSATTGGPVDKSVLRKQESLIVKQSKDAAAKRAGAAIMEKAAPGSSKFLPPAPTVVVPKWMSDSAAHNPEYRDYLKSAGVILPDEGNGLDQSKPTAPRVPGAPIVRPKTP